MTGDALLLDDVRQHQGGHVSFAGDKGGFITGLGTLTNGKVSFENVNYCKDLENNLLSVSQICDKKYSILFDDENCYILKTGFKIAEDWVLMSTPRKNDLYMLNMNEAESNSTTESCFISKATERESVSWHRRMGHIHLRKMNQLVHKNLVFGVNVKHFNLSDTCVACRKGKQLKKSHRPKKAFNVNVPLELLHMDLFGPVKMKSHSGDQYCLVVTDEYSRFSWVIFLKSKSDTFENLTILIRKL